MFTQPGSSMGRFSIQCFKTKPKPIRLLSRQSQIVVNPKLKWLPDFFRHSIENRSKSISYESYNVI